jgi:hypothetical protein
VPGLQPSMAHPVETEIETYLHCSYPSMAAVRAVCMRDWTELEICFMPPATMRLAIRCCTQACIVWTRSVGAGEYVPASLAVMNCCQTMPEVQGCCIQGCKKHSQRHLNCSFVYWLTILLVCILYSVCYLICICGVAT